LIQKGPTILILLVVASAIMALGIFLDGEVIAPQPDNETLIKEAATQSALDKRRMENKEPSQPSEVSLQLESAIEATNQNDAYEAERLEDRVAKSKALIDETNQLLTEKGAASITQSSSEKSQQFNQQLNNLKSRLDELKSSD
jgi:hypothetical protein